MQTADIELKTSDGLMPAYEARPDGQPRGAIVVVQEAFGVTEHIRDICRRLAGERWLAVAPALYHREEGSPVVASQDLDEAMPHMQKLNQAGLDVDIAATLEWLTGQGFESEHQGIVGFCVGGSIAAHIAATHSLGAAVSFYGGGIIAGRLGMASQLESAPALKTPWLGLFGADDPSIPVDQVEDLRVAAMRSSVETEVEVFAGAGHAFNNDTRPENFRPMAAEEAWRRMHAWFEQHIVLEE